MVSLSVGNVNVDIHMRYMRVADAHLQTKQSLPGCPLRETPRFGTQACMHYQTIF